MESDKSTEAWIADLGAELAPTRYTAAYELSEIGDNRVVVHLATTLKDCYFSVRNRAAESLGILGRLESVGPLIEALQDDDRDFRTTVLNALGKITNEVFSTPEEWKDWYREVRPVPNLP
ncbi:MAG: HEAT repeat domain-containing protein [Planctomycetota bacterium]|jgi:HEAT repeat protein